MWYQFESFDITFFKPKPTAITRDTALTKPSGCCPLVGTKGLSTQRSHLNLHSTNAYAYTHTHTGGGREHYTRKHTSFLHHTLGANFNEIPTSNFMKT